MHGNITNNVKIPKTKARKTAIIVQSGMKLVPRGGQTAGFCTTAVCVSYPRREGDAPIAIPFGSQPNALPCGRAFTTTGTTYTTRTTILISHGQSRMSTDDTENDYMIEPTLKSGLNLLFYDSTFARARPARGRRNLAQGNRRQAESYAKFI